MGRHSDEETTLEGSRFWNASRILLVVVFIIGLAVGAFVTNKFIDNTAIKSTQSDSNSLLEENRRLDERNDTLFRCLKQYGVEPETCPK